MEIADFPRPEADTGVGIQWSLGYPAAIGIREIEARWIPRLRAMGISWVKFRHAGGQDFARLLLNNGITPVVQLWRLRPHPGRLTAGLDQQLKSYLTVGVRYFELGDMLDSREMWLTGKVPDRALALVLTHLLDDIDAVLDTGGLPGLPATRDLGPKWDLVGAICAAGRQEVFKAGVWQAYQIMAGNRPLDFPNDPVNLTGKSLTQEEYRREASESWARSAWGGHTRDEINAERLRRKDPEANLARSPAGWRRFEILDNRVRRHLGRSIPILGTAGGCTVGDRTDSRYPAVSPQGHASRILEMARIMMGTSEAFAPAPGFLFCAAFSLLGNYALGNMEPGPESLAWVSPRLPEGQLPIAEVLSNEPKRLRWMKAGESVAPATVAEVTKAPSDETKRESMTPSATEAVMEDTSNTEADTDELEIDESLVTPLVVGKPSGLLSPDNDEVDVREEDGEADRAPGRAEARTVKGDVERERMVGPPACLFGKLRGGAGMTITLKNVEDVVVASEIITPEDMFTFSDLLPGIYYLKLERTSLPAKELQLDPGAKQELILQMPEWMWQVRHGVAGNNFSIVRCSVEGQDDVPVRIWSDGWDGLQSRTGTRKEYGPFCCELAPLGAGHYSLKPEEPALEASLDLDGDSIIYVDFVRTKVPSDEPDSSQPSLHKGIERYLLLARPFANKDDLLAVMKYIRTHRPACGFSVEEARWAREVIIVGGGSLRVSREDERRMREHGCRVMRIEDDIEKTMLRLAGAGRVT